MQGVREARPAQGVGVGTGIRRERCQKPQQQWRWWSRPQALWLLRSREGEGSSQFLPQLKACQWWSCVPGAMAEGKQERK